MRLALQPGCGLGPFRLGAPLPEVLALVRQHANSFPCVELKYADQGSAAAGSSPPDIGLSFPEQGFHLLFDGRQQRLRLIDVHDTTRLQVNYGSHVFGGAAHAPTFGRVCEAFGPTYPGEAEGGQYPLQYPGILFLFPLASGSGGAMAGQLRAPLSSSIAGIEFPVALATPAGRILVHHGSAGCLAAARGARPPPLPPASQYCEDVEAVPGQGLLLGGSGAVVRFGDSPQDVVSELGEPSCTRAKAARPPGALAAAPQPPPPDYFYCFAPRGLDVLFCGTTHRAIKFVLHANAPGHPDFGLYAKCCFRVHPAGTWSLPGRGGAEEAGDSPHTYTSASAGSEGAGSMKTAASGNSLAALESAAGSPVQRQQQRQQRDAGTTTAAEAAAGAAVEAEAAASAAAAVAVASGASPVEASAIGDNGGSSQGPAAVGAALGRPPRPPSSLPIPTPPPSSLPIPTPPPSSKSLSKKQKKKERQRALAAARLLGGGGGGSGGNEESATDGDDTDASFADSAPSSLASSPGMTSFLSNIAATGGTGAGAPAAAAAAAAPSGCSSDGGSAADYLAGRERRLEGSSAFDGWSEADSLALLVGCEEAAAPAGPSGSAAAAAAAPQQQQQRQAVGKLRVSTAVQTAAVAELELPAADPAAAAAAAAAAAFAPDSPDSFVMADSSPLFDESAAAAEYESVPHQRSSGTQTQPHLLAGAPLRGGTVSLRHSGASAAAAASASSAAVGVDARLPDIQAAFGASCKPALHTRGRHPFGPTHLYAFQGAVFEVLKSGAITTVTLFEA